MFEYHIELISKLISQNRNGKSEYYNENYVEF